ncbi:MAG: MoaD/ThiS family protein [Cyclobacteriaceae bacterium]
MQVRLVAFGIARDILKGKLREFNFPGKNIGALKEKLVTEYPDFSKLRSLSFAVDEEYRPDDFELSEGEEVVIIPPVSGG